MVKSVMNSLLMAMLKESPMGCMKAIMTGMVSMMGFQLVKVMEIAFDANDYGCLRKCHLKSINVAVLIYSQLTEGSVECDGLALCTTDGGS